MVRSVAFIFVLLALLGAIGCEDQRVPRLQKRVEELEQKVKNLEEAKATAENEKSQKQTAFSLCVSDANFQYQRGIEDNGIKTARGTYSLPVVSLRELDRQKQSKIEECKLLYR